MQLKSEGSAGTWLSPFSPPVLHANQRDQRVFFTSFGETCCQDVCAAVPDGLNDIARWMVCSSGSDHWLGF